MERRLGIWCPNVARAPWSEPPPLSPTLHGEGVHACSKVTVVGKIETQRGNVKRVGVQIQDYTSTSLQFSQMKRNIKRRKVELRVEHVPVRA